MKAVLAIRGGWGCARVLPHLDWDVIRRNPKVVAGFSDITGLHCGLQAKAGFVTFHAPDALSSWPAFSVDQFRRVVFEGEALTMANPPGSEDGSSRGRTAPVRSRRARRGAGSSAAT